MVIFQGSMDLLNNIRKMVLAQFLKFGCDPCIGNMCHRFDRGRIFHVFCDCLVIIGHKKGCRQAPRTSSSTVPEDGVDLRFDVLRHVNMLLPHHRIL